MTNDDSMMTVFYILFIIFGIIGFLASVFNWEWYFGLSYKARRLSDLMGEKAYRVLNAIVCALAVYAAIYLLVNEGSAA